MRGAAAEARTVCNTWQVEASDLLGKTHGRDSSERWARRCRPKVLSAHLRKRPDQRTPRSLEGGDLPRPTAEASLLERETASWQEEDAAPECRRGRCAPRTQQHAEVPLTACTASNTKSSGRVSATAAPCLRCAMHG